VSEGEIVQLMRSSVDSRGQTTVIDTHDAHPAARTDCILFLVDGVLVSDLAGASQRDVIQAIQALAGA
jgi:putative ABC transport system ATP-binding protein